MKTIQALTVLAIITPSISFASVSYNSLYNETLKSTKLEFLPEIKKGEEFYKKEMFCLAMNIYHETQGSTKKDQFATGLVTLNRLKDHSHGDRICDVVWEKGQFSWTVMNIKNLIPKDNKEWIKSQRKAYLLLTDHNFHDFTNGATHFYNPAKVGRPVWTNRCTGFVRIGHHLYMHLIK